ncbi:MAG: GTP pyrophosphokinase family protein [Clostridiales bacterium]|jgi:putative GTP pyrophosphokinase|nr:GTP pyrophosphokinase family protein [Clostridiales bacterium]
MFISPTNWEETLLPYNQAVDELVVKFSSLAAGFRKLDRPSPIESVSGRVKRVSSILDKANRKSVATSEITEKIEDIAGIRIICRFIDDISVVIRMIKDRGGIDLEVIKERDYITSMKPSGYRSFHLIVRYPVITAFGFARVLCEIQIRTMAMNFWATIEHSLRYKYNGKIPEQLASRLISSSEAAAKLDDEMNAIHDEIMEAQIVYQSKTALVDEILDNIQRLYVSARVDELEDLNERFFALYEGGDFEKLADFNRSLRAMRDVYRI